MKKSEVAKGQSMADNVDIVVQDLSVLASWYRPPFGFVLDGVISPADAYKIYRESIPLLRSLNEGRAS